MELIVKQGLLLVELIKSSEDVDIHADLFSGKIISGANEVGMIVFFKNFVPFNKAASTAIVKMDDVLSWIKPEEPKVEVDEQKNDQA